MAQNKISKEDDCDTTAMLHLVVLLALGLAVRLSFLTGFGSVDDFFYMHAADALTQGYSGWMDRLGQGAGAVGLFGPVALLYELLGPSEAATLAWPLFTSSLSTIFIYGIARLMAGEQAGLLAAWIWIFLPQDILMATALLPDGPMAAFSTGAVFFLLWGERLKGGWRYAAYASSSICMLWALLSKPRSALTLGFILLYLAWTQFPTHWREYLARQIGIRGRRLLAASVGFAALLWLLYYASLQRAPFTLFLTTTATDTFELFATHGMYAYITPLFIIAVGAALAKPWQGSGVLLSWLAVLFLYYEWGSSHLRPWRVYTPVNSFTDQRNLLFILAPLVALVGIYLAQGFEQKTVRQLTLGWTAVFAPVLILYRLPQVAPIIDQVSILSGSVFLFASFASLRFLRGNAQQAKMVLTSLLFLSFSLAFILPRKVHVSSGDQTRLQRANLKAAADMLLSGPEYPIMVADSVGRNTHEALNFFTGFQLGYNQFLRASGRFRDLPADFSSVGSAYVLLTEEDTSDLPTDWWLLAQIRQTPSEFTRNPPELYIYRSLTLADAELEIQSVKQIVAERADAASLRRLFGLAINAQDLSLALDAYTSLRQLEPAENLENAVIDLAQARLESTPQIVGENLLSNPDFAFGLQGWEFAEELVDGPELDIREGSKPLLLSNSSGGEFFPLWQMVSLQPDTLYFYTVTLKSNAEISPLYWGVADVDAFLIRRSGGFNEWEHLSGLFITPHWESGQRDALVSPFFFRGPGETWVQSVSLAEMTVTVP